MNSGKTRVFLHIGRNKAGSTSLQDFFLANRERVAAQGLCYRPFGHLMKLVPDEPGFATHYEMIEHARSGAHNAYLLSNELMSGWSRDFTDRIVTDLTAEFDVQVLVYVRPHCSWVCSAYSQETKNGMTRQDFDAYLERWWPHISVWPKLQEWGEAIGWDRIRVRSLDPRDLVGGNLIADSVAAMGLDPALVTSVPRSNSTPHWTVLEMSRAISEEDRKGFSEAGWRVARPLQALMRECLTRHPVPDVAYLTAEQSRRLADLYNRDLGYIAEHTGTVLQPEVPDLRGRKMLPSFERIPKALLADWAARAAAPAFRADCPEAAEAAARLYKERGPASGKGPFARLLARFA